MDLGEWLQDELDGLALRIGHALSVDDPNGRVIAYSAQDASADPVRITSILSRRVTPAVQRWERQHGIAQATGPVHVPANPQLDMSARLCVPIRRRQSLIGYIWALETGDAIDDDALAAVSRFAAKLAEILDRGTGRRMMASGAASELVRQLLADPPAPQAADQLVAAFPSLLTAQIQVCAIVPAAPDREAVSALTGPDFLRLSTSLPASLRHLPGYIGSFVCTTHAVVLFRASPAPRSSRADPALDEVSAVAHANGRSPDAVFTVGISEPVAFSSSAARDALSQALATAELAALDPALPPALSWGTLGAYRALLSVRPVPEPALAPLTQAGNSASMLIRTLETYLDLGGDAQRTAAQLHLHRTSLYYRLGRIAEILQADLDDGLTRLELHLALKSRRAARRTLGPSSPH